MGRQVEGMRRQRGMGKRLGKRGRGSVQSAADDDLMSLSRTSLDRIAGSLELLDHRIAGTAYCCFCYMFGEGRMLSCT